MARTISTTVSGGVTLAPSDNALTVAPGGYVTGTIGIQGPAGTAWTIVQQGTVKGTTKYGISLARAGTVTNALDALITGPLGGVYVVDAVNSALVYNAGSITAGTIGSAIRFADDGQVSNAATGVILGGTGIKISGTGAQVSNLGQITGGTNNVDYGIYLLQGGTVLNGQSGPSTAIIQSYNGLAIRGSAGGIVHNYGTILGSGSEASAVDVFSTGLLLNGGSGATSALIQGGRYGVYFGEAGTVTNFATISDTAAVGAGVDVGSPGGAHVNNLGTAAKISGYIGVIVAYGTVTNSGTVISTQGASGTAVSFEGGSNLLIDDPGAVFVGTVAGPISNSNTIELSGSVAGTITNIGTSFTNFGTVLVDAGASWTMTGADRIKDTSATGGVTIGSGAHLTISGVLGVADAFALNGGTLTIPNAMEISGTVAADASFNMSGGTASALQLGSIAGSNFYNVITGFGPGDVINLTNVTFVSGSSVTTGGGTLGVQLMSGGELTFFNFASEGTPTFLIGPHSITDVACFASGTRIRTERGEIAVEALVIGDIAVLAGGRTSPVIWIGQRAVECRRHPDPDAVRPVCVAAGALGSGLPVRDLVLSPDHALYLDGVLIPVRLLVNGKSIARTRADRVTYYHVELAEHDLLLAEGAATESYLDTGDRSNFANGGGSIRLFADFSTNAAASWETKGCAPLIVSGRQLDAVRDWINRMSKGVADRSGVAA
jgi:collagen type I/II/III/V/XI/XXIV/XXVII alpha